eukprot:12423960-Karenia_brevis.AAC.1
MFNADLFLKPKLLCTVPVLLHTGCERRDIRCCNPNAPPRLEHSGLPRCSQSPSKPPALPALFAEGLVSNCTDESAAGLTAAVLLRLHSSRFHYCSTNLRRSWPHQVLSHVCQLPQRNSCRS